MSFQKIYNSDMLILWRNGGMDDNDYHIGFADGANKVLYYNNPMWPGTLISIPLVKLDYFSFL